MKISVFLDREDKYLLSCRSSHLNRYPGWCAKYPSTSITMAIFACMGGEQVIMTAGEAKHPWLDLPVVTSFAYLVPIILYPFAILAVGANVNYFDPNLAHPWARASPSQSPFVVAVQTTSFHGLPQVLNFFFIVSAYTAGYVTSSTLSTSCSKIAPLLIYFA